MDTSRKWSALLGNARGSDIVGNVNTGGQSIPAFEYDLAPGVIKSFNKHLKADIQLAVELGVLDKKYLDLEYQVDITSKGNEDTEKLFASAYNKTVRDTYQAMEALVHNLNTMASRAGSQVPFSSINLGTGTTPAQRLVIKSLLDALEAGLGNGETSIFPVVVFRVLDGVNGEPGDPNYDLLQQAVRVSSKRLYPTYEFLDAQFNKAFIKGDDYNTYVATMGCVKGDSTITYRLDYTSPGEHISFKDLWDKLSKEYTVLTQGNSEYIRDCPLQVFDTLSNTFVDVTTVIRNRYKDHWFTIKTLSGLELSCTGDHPLPIFRKGVNWDTDSPYRIEANFIDKRDYVINSYDPVSLDYTVDMVTDVAHTDNEDGYSYDVETVTDTFEVNGMASHNCRTRVMANCRGESTTSGRGNISFTTINLPRLAILSKQDVPLFFEKLDETMELVRDQLLERLEFQGQRKVKNFPFLMGNHVWRDSEKLHYDDTVGEVIKHGTLSIGFIGLAECLISLIGKHHGESDEAQQLGLKIVGHMRELCDQWVKEYNLNWSLLATPAESTCNIVKKDVNDFGIIEGVTDKEYYTNSMHVPVYYKTSITHKIDVEAPYHALCNAGHISYIELDGDVSKNPEAFLAILNYAKHAGIGYFAINVSVDRDPVCGYQGIINGDICPRCGRKEGEPLTDEQIKAIKDKFALRS